MDELYLTNDNMDEIAEMLNQIEPGHGIENAAPHTLTHTTQQPIDNVQNLDRLDISEILSFSDAHDDALAQLFTHKTDDTHTAPIKGLEDLYAPMASSLSIVDTLTSPTEHPTQYGLDYF